MRKITVGLAMTMILFIGMNRKSDAQCHAISIDSLFFDQSDAEIKGNIVNEGGWYIIYPILTMDLDTNQYISSHARLIPSYMDSSGGIKDLSTPVWGDT